MIQLSQEKTILDLLEIRKAIKRLIWKKAGTQKIPTGLSVIMRRGLIRWRLVKI